jgi:hypothetical protein
VDNSYSKCTQLQSGDTLCKTCLEDYEVVNGFCATLNCVQGDPDDRSVCVECRNEENDTVKFYTL